MNQNIRNNMIQLVITFWLLVAAPLFLLGSMKENAYTMVFIFTPIALFVIHVIFCLILGIYKK